MVEEIVAFVKKYGAWKDEEEILEVIPGFIKNNTYVILRRHDEIIAVCVWNMNSETAEIVELIIHPDCRSKRLIGFITALGWRKFPYLKFVKFERERKYPNRKPRVYRIDRLLGRKSL